MQQSIAMISQYPLYQPHLAWVTPTINCPAADPRVPVPSIMPVTVEIALAFPLSASCFPKSAEQEAQIMLFSPLMKKPKKNIKMKKSTVLMFWTLKVSTKLIVIEIKTAPNATGERFPYIRSEI